MTRIRNRESYTTGSVNHNGNITQYTALTSSESCEDTPGPGDCGPLTIRKRNCSGGIMNGTTRNGVVFANNPANHATNASWMRHEGIPSQSDGAFASELRARTNPSRSSVESIVSAAELRELPKLIRDAGEYSLTELRKAIPKGAFRGLKKAAKLNLMIQFGILPIISDVKKLLVFHDLVESRIRELQRLRSGKGLRRTVQLFSGSAVRTERGQYLHSGLATVYGTKTTSTSLSVRGHIRYYVSSDIASWSDSQYRAEATRAVLGLTLDFGVFWELMPWSWLIDWFSSTGDFISGSRNSVNASTGPLIIMRHTRSEISGVWERADVPTSSVLNTFIDKTRRITSPSISARLPFLTPGQTSILGSLAITRR